MSADTKYISKTEAPKKLFCDYEKADTYDEIIKPDGSIREVYKNVADQLGVIGTGRLDLYQDIKDTLFRSRDVTFNVYGNEDGTNRTWPLDLVPRVISADEWEPVESGLAQRLKAINLFLGDIYNGASEIINDGIIDEHFLKTCIGYDENAIGLPQPMNARALVAGIDLVRDENGKYLILEDNLRTPSGVSYVLENRSAVSKLLPGLMGNTDVRPVEQYPTLLLRALQAVAPASTTGLPNVVLLTPGVYNSAYFEHAFLAQNMGIELVEPRDLYVDEGQVFMHTTRGGKKVDVIYRRIDDEFMDPTVYNPDSTLGVPGIVDVVRNQRVSVANAFGNGVADNKAMYVHVPKMIEYYLNERPILDNVDTHLMADAEARRSILADPTNHVIKTVNGSGGYDIYIGPTSTDEETQEIIASVESNPDNYIAQRVVKLSTHPTIIDGRLEPRHIDLRPFIVGGEYIDVLPGGLTRVALEKGSLLVNSSQGGGSKDTWVLQRPGVTYSDSERPLDLCGQPREEHILGRASATLYWAGRYLERIDATSRLLMSSYEDVLGGFGDDSKLRWAELLEVLSITDEFEETNKEASGYAISRFLVDDENNAGSIMSCLNSVRDNLRSFREKVPTDLREVINDAWVEFSIIDFEKELAEHPQIVLNKFKRLVHTCTGIAESNMSRNDAWRMLNIGRMTERSLLIVRLCEIYFARLLDSDQPPTVHHWAGLLGTAGAVEEYRKIYQTSVEPMDAIEFLLRNTTFSRSLIWCIRQAEAHLVAMEINPLGTSSSLHQCQIIRGKCERPLEQMLGSQPSYELNKLAQSIEKMSDLVASDYFGQSPR